MPHKYSRWVGRPLRAVREPFRFPQLLNTWFIFERMGRTQRVGADALRASKSRAAGSLCQAFGGNSTARPAGDCWPFRVQGTSSFHVRDLSPTRPFSRSRAGAQAVEAPTPATTSLVSAAAAAATNASSRPRTSGRYTPRGAVAGAPYPHGRLAAPVRRGGVVVRTGEE
jgi:hypothetical protein